MPIEFESNIPAFFLKLFGKKVVMDWDDMFEDGLFKSNYLIHSYIKFCENFFPFFIKNLTVTTDNLKTISLNRGATNVLTLINGVNTNQFIPINKERAREKLNLNKKFRYILLIGNSLSPIRAKPILTFINKLIKINSKIYIITNFNLNNIAKQYHLSHLINSKISKQIINPGYIYDLSTYLSAVDASMFLTPNNLAEKTSFPIRIGTYLCGLSIIIINDTGTQVNRLLKKYNCAITDKNISNLAQKTSDTLFDHKKILFLRKNVKIAKHQLSWPKIIHKLIKYYQKL